MLAFMALRSLVLILLGAVAISVLSAARLTGDYWMLIVDQKTGHGIPNVRVTTDSGIVCTTDLTGAVRWSESEFMGRDVKFRIEKPGYRFPGNGTTVRVSHFRTSVLKMSAH